MNDLVIINADAVEGLQSIESESAQCCVTSPPYWGLRDYGVEGQIGLEETPEAYIERLCEIFDEVWRVLRSDGTLWVNIGDSYAGSGKGIRGKKQQSNSGGCGRPTIADNLKPKDLVGIPWMLAFALRARGWYLRCDMPWIKPNAMCESVIDRPTRAHEYVFLLSKAKSYYFNRDAVMMKPAESTIKDRRYYDDDYEMKRVERGQIGGAQQGSGTIVPKRDKQRGHSRRHAGFNERWNQMTKAEQQVLPSNCRSWLYIPARGYSEGHFATFPPELPQFCILAGSKPGDRVLDPFGGSGTTGMVALQHGRQATLIELNPDYVKLIEQRCATQIGLGL